jgi:hypothetical protein
MFAKGNYEEEGEERLFRRFISVSVSKREKRGRSVEEASV